MSSLPLTALRAFDKVAEHLSFTRAAEALHVTQSAVSQQVGQLEERLGKRLLERSGRNPRLTPHGEMLAAACQRSFGTLERTMKQIARGSEAAALRFKLPPSFAMKWLMPRLPGFQVEHPQMELQISTSVLPVNFDTEDIDIGMQRAAEPGPGLYALALMDETGILVCSPKLWSKRRRAAGDLASMTLLCSVNRQEDWSLWREASGASGLQPANQIAFGFSLLMYQAAIEGLGFCIAQPEFVADDVAAGRLVAPFAQTISTGKKHYLVCPLSLRHDPAVARFFSWVQQTAQSGNARG